MSDDEAQGLVSALPSKAATEVLLAATSGVSQGIKGTAADIWGGLIGDRIHQWRQRNLVNSLEKTAHYLEQKGVALSDVAALPDGPMYMIFDGASKAETNEIRELWGRLLAKEMCQELDEARLPLFVDTLGSITSDDVKLLELLIGLPSKVEDIALVAKRRFSKQAHESDLGQQFDNIRQEQDYLFAALKRWEKGYGLTSAENIEFSKQNLRRLGLIEPVVSRGQRRGMQGLTNTRFATEMRVFAGQIDQGFDQIEQAFNGFEDWVTSRLAGWDRPWADTSSLNSLAVYFKLTAYGNEFTQSVGAHD